MNSWNNEDDEEMDEDEDLSVEFEDQPQRNGRRESEPHSFEVTYLFKITYFHFPESRIITDLHHFFRLNGKVLDLLFDVTYYPGLKIPHWLEEFDSAKYGNRVPEMVINVLSMRTWKKDCTETVKKCHALRIPIYMYFTPYDVAPDLHQPPYLKVYMLDENMDYKAFTIKEYAAKEGEAGFDLEKMVSLAPRLYLAVGLELLERKMKGGTDRCRLFFVDLTENVRLKTELEMLKEANAKRSALNDMTIELEDKTIAKADATREVNAILKDMVDIVEKNPPDKEEQLEVKRNKLKGKIEVMTDKEKEVADLEQRIADIEGELAKIVRKDEELKRRKREFLSG